VISRSCSSSCTVSRVAGSATAALRFALNLHTSQSGSGIHWTRTVDFAPPAVSAGALRVRLFDLVEDLPWFHMQKIAK